MVLNQWYPFDNVGRYKISVRIIPTAAAPATFQNWVTLPTVNVLPEDPQRITEICVELRDRIESTMSADDVLEAALALSYVDDPIAVPYLQDIATVRGGVLAPTAVKGLERIDERAGIIALMSLSGQQDQIVRAVARSALAEMLPKTKDPSLRDEIKQALATQ